jgi:hypothetical protein
MPSFKPGRLAEMWLNGVDVSTYFESAVWNVKLETAKATTFKASWKSFLAGDAYAWLTANGYYDSADADKVRDTLQAAVGQLTYVPAGGLAIGDLARLLNVNTSAYQNTSRIKDAVAMAWTAQATAPVGIGNVLHVMQSEAPGTITGTGSDLGTGTQTLTGAVAHLHVTAMTGGDTHTFKLQNSATLGGVYTDITSGAFVNVTAVGSQRLVVPGTIQGFVKLVAVISGHAATYACAAART